MSKHIQTPERVKSCLKACEDFADPVSAVRDNFAFGTDMANTVNRLRAINTELVAALKDMVLCHDQGPDSEDWLRDKAEGFMDPLDMTGDEEERIVQIIHERTLDKARAAIAKAQGEEK